MWSIFVCMTFLPPANQNISFSGPKHGRFDKWLGYLPKCHFLHINSINFFTLITNLPKFITCSFLIQFEWDFLCCVHHDLYFFIIIFPEFLDEWFLNGLRVCDMWPNFVHFAKSIVKWWECIQWLPNFLCLN